MDYKMVYEEFSSGGGMGSIFSYASSVVPFYPALLFGIILAVLHSLYILFKNQKKEEEIFQLHLLSEIQ